ncbi:uncharacterized protein IWZ02DRAFT_456878 [Phyllosticta citriasiana]|uniref:Uncharacterized protein n=1 Tax=Phyllosticta citriasiana TaxID=595635 RepID=A0ABR1K927_9PEZI
MSSPNGPSLLLAFCICPIHHRLLNATGLSRCSSSTPSIPSSGPVATFSPPPLRMPPSEPLTRLPSCPFRVYCRCDESVSRAPLQCEDGAMQMQFSLFRLCRLTACTTSAQCSSRWTARLCQLDYQKYCHHQETTKEEHACKPHLQECGDPEALAADGHSSLVHAMSNEGSQTKNCVESRQRQMDRPRSAFKTGCIGGRITPADSR